ncbi:hypothetical protein OTB20_40920 [Streptomyces sp. H27-H1]|uniref:hypothetical protein n=1 Tax=Streptomyces sp. H27-H1 TaxID=2996461 RepID=UPI002271DBD7|nr:hypothetical protein [Streptomyces sp. H27-H1]MCY0932403.1 hypothetical protein [Streptomyces sp. H27-H1]
MNSENNDSLEVAAQNLRDALEALHTARRNLTQATLTAYANGEPVTRIAERTGRTETWNTLAVHGITRGTHLNGSPQLTP